MHRTLLAHAVVLCFVNYRISLRVTCRNCAIIRLFALFFCDVLLLLTVETCVYILRMNARGVRMTCRLSVYNTMQYGKTVVMQMQYAD